MQTNISKLSTKNCTKLENSQITKFMLVSRVLTNLGRESDCVPNILSNKNCYEEKTFFINSELHLE